MKNYKKVFTLSVMLVIVLAGFAAGAKKAVPYSSKELMSFGRGRSYTGKYLSQIAMPIGGIGAGSIALTGYGSLQDFSIKNKPEFYAQYACWSSLHAGFALLHIKGAKPVTRLVEGPFPKERIYANGTKSLGMREGGHEGLPRFKDCSFKNEYPFGKVSLRDPKLPVSVELVGFDPFIPLDDKNSSIPCAILEYKITNTSRKAVDYEFSYHLSHLAANYDWNHLKTLNTVIDGKGVYFANEEEPVSENFGNATLTVIGHEPVIKGMWLRSPWWDSISALWREVSTGNFQPNNGSNGVDINGRNGGSIMMAGSLQPGESIMYPVVITWYFPNCYLVKGRDNEKGAPLEKPHWKPYYASQWSDAKDVAEYVHTNYAILRGQTQQFRDAFSSSTLPDYVLDAVSSNLAIIKSPTVLRQANGNLWAWEGVCHEHGSCYGTCTHVWNYAQVLPNLFPSLERGLREMELVRSMNDSGQVKFRSALPDGVPTWKGHAASDGQLGGIMKVYRDYQICGDRQWAKKMYPLAKKSLDYCIEAWDPGHKGVLEEPHHNTYDINFWGADGMCSSIYIGALSALVEMGRELGHPESKLAFYENLAKSGADYLDKNLFNGEYYYQKVEYEKLRDQSFMDMINNPDLKESEVVRLLRKEGPKYQYGSGCISDGVIGAWMAEIYGIATPRNQENIKKNLKAIFEYNFKKDLSEHACLQRPGYATGQEAGLLLCTWPYDGKPTLPFVYSDEVWTGIEYQTASHMISQGLVPEGLTIVKALRNRYDGHVRNPFNEYECGSYYARAQASYALMSALSGFRYSAAQNKLFFAPKLKVKNFKCFFSTATGWGTIGLDKKNLTISMEKGQMKIDALEITLKGKKYNLYPGVTATVGKDLKIAFAVSGKNKHTLFIDGKTDYKIVAGPADKPVADELAKYLKQISGTGFEIINEPGNTGKEIVIGLDAASKYIKTGRPDKDDEGFRIFNKGNRVLIYGQGRRGTLYGVYTFLEELLGCRWYTSKVKVIPQKNGYTFSKINIQQKPAITFRSVDYFDVWQPAMAVPNKNNAQFHGPQSNPDIQQLWLEHSFDVFVPVSEFFDSHPEYFSLIDGKRQKDRSQLCLTNSDVLRITIERLRQYIAKNPQYTIYNVAQNDNKNPCQCKKCQTIVKREKAESGIMLWFVNQVVDAVGDEFPNKYIGTFAYQYTRKPPEHIKPHKDLIIVLCSIECDFSHPFDHPNNQKFLDDLRNWQGYTDNILIWDYVVNYRHYFLPHPNFNVLQKNIQILRDAGVKAVLEQANGQGYGSEFEGLRAWVLTKLLWDPDTDMRLLIEDYINGYYQKSAPSILQYFDLVQSLVTKDSYLTYATKLSNPIFTPEFLNKANRIFDEAEAAADNEEILHRIEIARLGIIFMNIAADYSQADKKAELARLIEITDRENIVWSSEGWQTTKLIEEIKKRMAEK